MKSICVLDKGSIWELIRKKKRTTPSTLTPTPVPQRQEEAAQEAEGELTEGIAMEAEIEKTRGRGTTSHLCQITWKLGKWKKQKVSIFCYSWKIIDFSKSNFIWVVLAG